MQLDFGPIYTSTGIIHQIEYAKKCANNGSTLIAINTPTGCVFVAEKPRDSKLYDIKEEKRISRLKSNILFGGSGLDHDIIRMKLYASQQFSRIKQARAHVSPNDLKNTVSEIAHIFTTRYGCRPFGCNFLYAHSAHIPDIDGHSTTVINKKTEDSEIKTILFTTDCSGHTRTVNSYAVGKGSNTAITELEKLMASSRQSGENDSLYLNFTVEEALDHGIRILHKCFDPLKDKEFDIEVGILAKQYRTIPDDEIERTRQPYLDLNVDDE